MSRLGERLLGLEELGAVEYKLGDLEELLETFMPQAMLFLDEEGREKVLEKVSDEALDAAGTRAAPAHRYAAGAELSSGWCCSIRWASPRSFSSGSRHGAGRPVARLVERLPAVSKDQRMLLLLAKPSRPPQDVEFNKRLVRVVRDEIEALRPDWAELAHGVGEPFPRSCSAGAT